MSNTLKIIICTINLFLITINISFAQGNTFKLSGNNNIGPNDFLGSTNNAALIFKANNTEMMRLNPNGSVDFADGVQLNLMGTANLDTIVSKYINTTSLFAAIASINNLNANNGTIINLQSVNLQSIIITSDTINASHLNVTTIENINVINTNILTADQGTIDQLETTNLTTSNLKATSLSGSGTELVKVQSDGTFERFPLSNNITDVLRGNGTFGPGAWTVQGNDIHTTQSGNVGIGINTASEKLEVIGNAKISGTLFANDIEVEQMLEVEDLEVSGILTANEIHANNLLKLGTSSMYLQGGSIIPGSQNSIYTDNGDLFLQSSGNTFNTIINNGNNGQVGIGTNSPSSKLYVTGFANVAPLTTIFAQCGVSPSGGITCDGTHTIFEILKPGLGPFSPPTPILTVKDTGSIGIGTADVHDKLHLYRGALRIDGSSPSTLGPTDPGDISIQGIRMGTKSTTGGVAGPGLYNYIQTYNQPLAINPKGGKLLIGSDETDIYNGGTVNIVSGSSIGYALVISGDESTPETAGIRGDGLIFCKEIIMPGSGGANFRVQNNGEVKCRKVNVTAGTIGDYVFEEDYKLMSLRELEEYVQNNKHLPSIPSAKEIEQNNNEYDLSKMVETLLIKVEELTLYTIEQEKRIKDLEKTNE